MLLKSLTLFTEFSENKDTLLAYIAVSHMYNKWKSKTAERLKAHTQSLNNTVRLCAETRTCWLTEDWGNQSIKHSDFHWKNKQNSKIWNSEKCWISEWKRMGLSPLNSPCHEKFILWNICWYLYPISRSLAILQKMSATLTIMMRKYFSTAYLKNLSTHAQASPVSDLCQSIPSLAKPAYLLRHYDDASQRLNTLI